MEEPLTSLSSLSELNWGILDSFDLPEGIKSHINIENIPENQDLIFFNNVPGRPCEYHIYIRENGVWQQAKTFEKERFYRASAALERMKHPPRVWQENLFPALLTRNDSAIEFYNDETAVEFTVDELRVIAAIQKMYEDRNYQAIPGVGCIKRVGCGSWGLSGEYPNLFFSVTEGLSAFGAKKYKTKDGKKAFTGWERKKFLTAIDSLSKRDIPYRITSKRMVEKKDASGKTVWEPEVKILTPTPRPLFYIVEETDWMNNEQLARYQSGGRGAVKYILIEPSPIFFLGIKSQSIKLSNGRADYILKPWNLYDDIARVNPKAVKENIRLAEYLLKELAERRQHAPKDKEISYMVTRTEAELARAMNWTGAIRAGAWLKIHTSLRRRFLDLKKAKYLLAFHTERTTYGRKYHLELNPEKCRYNTASGVGEVRSTR